MNHTKEPCTYCSINDEFFREMFISDDMRILVLGKTLMIIQKVLQDNAVVGISNIEVPISHCPLCGRKLEDV